MSRFPPEFLEEIKDRLPISEVVGTRVSWDKRKSNPGRGDFWACCPVHGEKTASFHCENRKGRYYCFGCQATGDHFRFLVDLDRITFPEAVEKLAAQAGLPVPRPDAATQEREKTRATLHDVMEMAAGFFELQLQASAGARARAYLRERGVSPKAQIAFRLGYAPDSRNALKEFLAGKSATREQIEACGLVRYGDDIPVSYDYFRDRIMFPIPDSRGRFIAFGGRALSPDALAKYLNSPETELFHKGNVLYNFARARKAVAKDGTVIAVEGYMDVIALAQAGFENVVAPLGTALTENQLELLWRMTVEPVLCFDGDEAGKKAAWRAIDLAMPLLRPGRSVRFALLPQGRDPDDVVREEGPDAMRLIIDAALPLSEMLWQRETAAGSFETPEKRAGLEARLRQIAGTIGDASLRRHYAQDLAERMASRFLSPAGAPTRRRDGNRTGSAGARFGRQKMAPTQSLLNSRLVRRNAVAVPLRDAVLVATVANHPAILASHLEDFSRLQISSNAAHGLRQAVLDIFAAWESEGRGGTPERMHDALAASDMLARLDDMNRQLRENRIWQALPDAAHEDALEGWLQALALHVRANHLQRELRAAEMALAEEENEENFERLAEIRSEYARADGIEALVEGFGLPSGRPVRRF